MCRPTVQDPAEAEVLERLQQRLQQQMTLNCAGSLGPLAVASRGSGPRVFCGHVPPECTEELVKAHFSQWGHVTDVYFPKRKDTYRRRPFCFVTFARQEDAQRAVAESPMSICGIPIKQLNVVEDRADYYKQRHQAAQSALVQAIQTLTLINGEGGGAAGPTVPTGLAAGPALDLKGLTALLSMQASNPQQAYQQLALGGIDSTCFMPNATPTTLPFANLPGFPQTGFSTAAGAGLPMPAAATAFMPVQQPSFPAGSAGAIATALAGGMVTVDRRTSGSLDWPVPGGAASPFSTLEPLQHASAASSPPRGEARLAAALSMQRGASLGSARSLSPDPLAATAANRLAMWQLHNELLERESAGMPMPAPATAPWCGGAGRLSA